VQETGLDRLDLRLLVRIDRLGLQHKPIISVGVWKTQVQQMTENAFNISICVKLHPKLALNTHTHIYISDIYIYISLSLSLFISFQILRKQTYRKNMKLLKKNRIAFFVFFCDLLAWLAVQR
jgi:hypothetical protein